MDRRVDEVAMEATVLSIVAAALLIGAGTVGLAASAVLLAALGVTAVAFYLLSDRFPTVGRVLGHDVDQYLWDLWAAPLAAAGVVALALDAGPEEVVALGGLVGLAGMANYFLRPIYHLLAALVTAASDAVGLNEEDRSGG